MNLALNGKTALVCGSSQGIGLAIAQELARLGAAVVLLARDAGRLETALNTLERGAGQTHRYLVADFNDLTALQTALDGYTAAGGRAEILINNTGGPAGGPLAEAKPEQLATAFAQHLLCNQVLAAKLLPLMRAAGYGRVINIISTSVKQPLENLGVSNTIRGAVASWGKTLANEWGAHGITVNNLLPGATKTVRLTAIIEAKAAKTGRAVAEIEAEMLAEIPAGRFAAAEEIAAAAAFLASPAAGYINGINLPVDGGRLRTL